MLFKKHIRNVNRLSHVSVNRRTVCWVTEISLKDIGFSYSLRQ
jgi:hypothetical protein